MPLVRVDLQRGRSKSELKAILDAEHKILVQDFGVPARDRYQIVTQHDPEEMEIEDTGFGIDRTDKFVMIQITMRGGRTETQKRTFYEDLVKELQSSAGIEPNDVMVVISENGSPDWSFGNGAAQFLN
ncbi:tautomerase family protein [Furfurilactobacillus milii]|uniref:Tautomerase family protein n=2 Tax=Furfurilactobacillus TaxID=2767882 RepID=A0A6N9I0B1_9LACO|nr:tautomerase family protein [Furfurilactobacillus milii]MYV04810.1 tautomerase family protein [Furfurilactobacillus milii]MYV16360.1 tautomerase family protein [Furfurilactobacillus milii]